MLAVGAPTPASTTTSRTPACRASTLTAAPPERKLASICTVTSCGYALTPSAATPWSAAATTIAASGTGGTATSCNAPMRTAICSSSPRLPRGFVFRSNASCVSDIAEPQRLSGDDEERLVGGLRPGGVHPPEDVAVGAGESVRRDDAEADLVRDRDRRPRPHRDVELRLPPRLEQVRDPERQAIDDDAGVRRRRRDGAVQLERLLDGLPARRPPCTVARDPLRHLLVARRAGRDEHHGAARRLREPDRKARLPAPRPSEEHRQTHRAPNASRPAPATPTARERRTARATSAVTGGRPSPSSGRCSARPP